LFGEATIGEVVFFGIEVMFLGSEVIGEETEVLLLGKTGFFGVESLFPIFFFLLLLRLDL
jgi:hypothetical protein